MQTYRVIEENVTPQNNETAEETVVCQSNRVEQESLSCQDNTVVKEAPTLQENIMVEEVTETSSAIYVDKKPTASTTFEEEPTATAVEYAEEAPSIQDNAIEEEATTVAPTISGEEEAPEETTPRTDIVGSAAVSKDVTVGGHARVGDDSLFKRNVTIEGWLDAKSVKGNLKEWLDYGALKVKVLSDTGNVIHNGEGKVELTAYVYYRNVDITERIYEGRFSWKRESADTTGDRIWNRLHEGIGRRCTVTDEDVDRNAIFTCEVNIDGTSLDTEN